MLFYNILLLILAPFALARLIWKSRQNYAYRQNIAERFAFSLPPAPERPLWIHTVSVGEFLATRPLLIYLLEKDRQLTLWLTCTTPTGREQITNFQKQYPTRIQYSYLPYDLGFNNRRMLSHLKPRAIILVETEIWPNLITTAKKKNIPVLLINARLSARSLRGYYRFARHILQKPLQGLKINAQTRQTARRFQILGSPKENITITPNLKYQTPPIQELPTNFQTLQYENFQWLAASTHSGEEEIILSAQEILQQTNPRARLIIAPRHPERRQEIKELVKKHHFNPLLWSKKQYPQNSGDILIIDTLGELNYFYQLIDVAFIGGSLIAHGGHNPLEALHAQKPIIFGSSMFNFEEIAREICTQPFAKQLTSHDPKQLAQTLLAIKNQATDDAITTYIQRHHNIVIQHANFIFNHIGEKKLCKK